MRNILIVVGGAVAVVAIAAGVYFGTRPPSAGQPPVAVAATPDKSALLQVQATDHVLGDPKEPAQITWTERRRIGRHHSEDRPHGPRQLVHQVAEVVVHFGIAR